MSSNLNHRVACELARYIVTHAEPIATDLGVLTLHSDGDHVPQFVARLTAANGVVRSFAVKLTVGDLPR